MIKNVKFFLDDVRADLANSADAIHYYRELWADGNQYLSLKGRLDRLYDEQAGILKYYQSGKNDCAMILKWLQEIIKHKKAKKKIWFMGKEAQEEYGKIAKTDIDDYIASDEEIFQLIELAILYTVCRDNLNDLVENLKTRGYMASMLGKVKIAGEEGAFIDSTVESDPETL